MIHFANEAVHLLLHRADKRHQVVLSALGFELHPAVGQIADVAGDIELPGDLQDGVAKADALHVSGEENGFVMNLCHLGSER